MSTPNRASTWSPLGRNEAGVGGSHSREWRADSQTTDAQLTKSATDSGATEFKQDILLYGKDFKTTVAVALFDTQCQAGDWISSRLVENLKKTNEVARLAGPPGPYLEDVNGRDVVAHGSITLVWKLIDGNRTHDAKFYVFANSDHLDVLFGVKTIVALGAVSFNKKAIAPMTIHKKMTLGEKARIALLEEQQRQEIATLEAKKLELGNGK